MSLELNGSMESCWSGLEELAAAGVASKGTGPSKTASQVAASKAIERQRVDPVVSLTLLWDWSVP